MKRSPNKANGGYCRVAAPNPHLRRSARRMMKRIAALIITLAVAGCSDTVRTEFKTLDEAKQANAFSRGWLPPLLPDGTTRIVEVNDLDVNHGHGSFHFPAESTSPYLETLGAKHGATVTKSILGISVVVTNENTRWVIKLDPKNGTGEYTVKYTQREQNKPSEAIQ